MAFDMVKFERGQIWWIHYRDKNGMPIVNGREQAKDRPWLILSIGKFNSSSGMITAVPITTRDHVVSPAQVLFTNSDNEKNVIMCEQIKTFDWKSGAYLLEYKGTVSNEVLEWVDDALTIHLGMRYAPATLNRLYNSIEAMVRSLERSKSEREPKFTDDDILQFAEKLESLVAPAELQNVITPPTPQAIVTSKPENPTSSFTYVDKNSGTISTVNPTPVSGITEDKEIESSTSDSKRARTKWTKEKCEEFLHDMDNLPMREVMKKWDISKKPRLYSTKNYVKSLLEKE